jgi:hypothetical protein
LFAEPIPSNLAYRFARWIKSKAVAQGVECFPKQPQLDSARRYGNWLRLPGKHHRREHWSRFYDLGTEEWCNALTWFLLNAPLNDPGIVEALLPVLPSLPQRTPPAAVSPLPAGVLPVCIRDLLQNGIRKAGDRNVALLTLMRFWKSSGVSQDEAIAQSIEFVKSIPPRLTTSSLTVAEIATNIASVAEAVYCGHYPFECWHVQTLGMARNPIQCNVGVCHFVRRTVETVPATTGRREVCCA